MRCCALTGARAGVHGERDAFFFAGRQARPISGSSPTVPGALADDALIGRFVDAQLRLGLHQVGLGLLEARLGLRDVGDGELADAEAFARGIELLHQHPDVVLARIDDADVAHQVGVGGDRPAAAPAARCPPAAARCAWMLAWAVLVSATVAPPRKIGWVTAAASCGRSGSSSVFGRDRPAASRPRSCCTRPTARPWAASWRRPGPAFRRSDAAPRAAASRSGLLL